MNKVKQILISGLILCLGSCGRPDPESSAADSGTDTRQAKAELQVGTEGPAKSPATPEEFEQARLYKHGTWGAAPNANRGDDAGYAGIILEALIKKNFDLLERESAGVLRRRAGMSREPTRLSTFYGAFEISEWVKAPVPWANILGIIEQWREKKPDSIAARLAHAKVLIDYAWEARGGGWANTVKPANRKLFRERIEEAAEVLAPISDRAVDHPIYWSCLITIAKAQGWPKEKLLALTDDILAADPLYFYNYRAVCFYLLPRWAGGDGDWERWLNENAKAAGDRSDEIYGLVASWMIAMHWRAETDPFRADRLSWERVHRGMKSLCEGHPEDMLLKSLLLEACYYKQDGVRGLALASTMNHQVDNYSMPSERLLEICLWLKDERELLD